jgi:hypothetical protein
MRIDELKIDDARQLTRTVWDQKAAAEKWLRTHGYKKISNKDAAFATVWTDHQKSVVKVFARDPCYKSFITFCRSNRGDPHLPRLTKLYPIGEDGGIVFIEMLKPIAARDKNFVEECRAYFVNQQKIAAGARFFQPPEVFDDLRRVQPTLLQTLDKLAGAFPYHGSCACDLHWKNMMMRGSTYVITDPMESIHPND